MPPAAYLPKSPHSVRTKPDGRKYRPLEFHTLTVVNGLKYWLTSREVDMSADEALEFYRFLMSHPILDVVGQVEDYTEQEQTEG